MDHSLIPFGFHLEQEKLLSISEVENGKDCGCICPFCKIPLVARHPRKEIIPHFAHSSSATYKEAKARCTYNFYLSLRMFCRQLVVDNLEVTLPEFKKTVTKRTATAFPELIRYEYWVTIPKKVNLTNVQAETFYQNTKVDFIVSIKGFTLIIYLTHPERSFPPELLKNNSHEENVGILEIKLDHLYDDYTDKSMKASDDFMSHMQNQIQNNTSNKKWHLHPRENKTLQEAMEILEQKVEKRQQEILAQEEQERNYAQAKKLKRKQQQIASRPAILSRLQANTSTHYICRHCLTQWPKSECYICPKCLKKCD